MHGSTPTAGNHTMVPHPVQGTTPWFHTQCREPHHGSTPTAGNHTMVPHPLQGTTPTHKEQHHGSTPTAGNHTYGSTPTARNHTMVPHPLQGTTPWFHRKTACACEHAHYINTSMQKAGYTTLIHSRHTIETCHSCNSDLWILSSCRN